MMERVEALNALPAKVEAGKPLNLINVSRAIKPAICVQHAIRAHLGSLDAAKALHEAVLPGMFIRSIVQRGHSVWEISIWPEYDPVERHKIIQAKNPTPARAWLIAILKALIAQGDA